jgi:hypothetical protein
MKIENIQRAQDIVKEIDSLEREHDQLSKPGCQVRLSTPGSYQIRTIEQGSKDRGADRVDFLMKALVFDIEERIAALKTELNEL